MIIVDESEALARVSSPNNLTNKLVEVRKLHSNRTGRKEIPPMVTALAVATSVVSTQKSAGETFGMTQGNVSYTKNHGKNEETQELIKKNVDTVHEKALDGMMKCLDFLNPKLENVKKATELASIASNLARVVEKTSPKDITNSTNVKVVVYAPRERTEDEYESIAV